MNDPELSRMEELMRSRADDELEALHVARRATGALAGAIEGTVVPQAPEPAPPDWYTRAAILNLCVIALRSARGCITLIASGYEPEAHGLKRRLSEVTARIGAVVDDTSGQHAQEWLEGRGPSTPRKIASKFANLELFDLYSESMHADSRGVLNWLAVPLPRGGPHHKGLIVLPDRRPEFANAMLVEVGYEARDLANLMAKSRGKEIPNRDELDKQLVAAKERWHTASSSDEGQASAESSGADDP